MRVRGGPQIIEHLCIDCTVCMAACPAGAIAVAAVAEGLAPSPDAVLIVPPAFLAQFGRMARPARVAEVLGGLGFGDVWVTGGWRRALAAAVAQQAAESPLARPILSPACPAAMNLVAARFPSLIGHVAPLASPLEVIHEELAGRRAVFVALCPAERSVLASAAGPATVEVILPETLREAVLPRLAEGRPDNLAVAAAVSPAGQAQRLTPDASLMSVAGARHVLHVLEEMENGQLGDVTAIELSMCDEGCWGAPTLAEDPYVAEHRLPAAAASDARGKAARRRTPLVARAGLRLDADMARAMEKLARIQKIVHTLPGMDCGLCGSPTCAALAEDIVLGRVGSGPATAPQDCLERVLCVRLAEQEKGTP
jgi:Fe-S-cluster-containing hydrogenase component 2